MMVKAGTFGDIATLSFYPAHHITMGEGGGVFTQSSILKKLFNLLEIGVEIVGVIRVAIILVKKDLNGN